MNRSVNALHNIEIPARRPSHDAVTALGLLDDPSSSRERKDSSNNLHIGCWRSP